MHETEPTPQQNTADRIQELYPTYMLMIRTFVGEGILEAEQPSERQARWAKMAGGRDPELVKTLGQLARLTETAYKQRYLEGMPMLIDFDIPPGGDPHDFDTIERFHFWWLFIKDYRAMKEVESPIDNVPAVLCVDPTEDIA